MQLKILLLLVKQVQHDGSAYKSVLIFNSFNCFSSIVLGLSIITSLPELFLGKAITSRIESKPAKIEVKRSKPKAIPPCGGAPNSKASIKKPNCFCASSALKPKCLNIKAC